MITILNPGNLPFLLNMFSHSQSKDFEHDKNRSIVTEFQALLKLEVSHAYVRYGRGRLYDSSLTKTGEYASPALWRETFVGRCYVLVDLYEYYFSRETIDIAMSYLDAYLYRKGGDMFEQQATSKDTTDATPQSDEPMIKMELLIASSACLFIAIKLHEPDHHFDIPTIIRINNGHFTRQQIIDAEKDILTTLDFRLSPPTVMSFIRIYLAFLKGSRNAITGEIPLSEEAINQVTGLARFLSELSLYDIFFVDKDESKIALACVLTAFEGVSREVVPQAYRQRVVDCVYREGSLNCTDECVYKCRVQLRNIFESRRSIKRKHPS